MRCGTNVVRAPGRRCCPAAPRPEFLERARHAASVAPRHPQFRGVVGEAWAKPPAGAWSRCRASSPTMSSSTISPIAGSSRASFIRRADQLDYLQEPDVFHDVFGHVPMLAHPVFADYMQAYGQGVACARQKLQRDRQARPPLLVHGRVRPDQKRRRPRHLWCGHRLLARRKPVRAGRSFAQPDRVRHGARDAHATIGSTITSRPIS